MPRAALRLLVLALLLAAGSAARAQGLYPPAGGGYTPELGGNGYVPPAGIDTRVGDLRGYFAQAFGNVPAPQAPTITYSAGIDVSETYDTDAVPAQGHSTHDVITRITPGVGVNADSARITGSLFYNPSVDIYTYHGNQNAIQQNLNAGGDAIIIPDWLFLDVRAYAAQQSVTGFNGPQGTTVLNRSNSVQSTSFTVAPTVRHRFGDLAVAEVGYSASYSTFNTGNTVNPGSNNAALLQALNQTSISRSEHAFLGTGDDFGQFSDAITATASQSSGSGLFTTQDSQVISDNIGYALTREITLTGSIGHEDITYSGPTPYRVNDVIWNVGAHLVPNPDSSVDLGYGHQNGGSSFYLNGNYAYSANTFVFATYQQSINTNLGNFQNAVAATTVGPNGVTFNPLTGAPTTVSNNFAGLHPGLFRTTTASIAATVVHPRDIYNLSFAHSNSQQLENGIAGSSIDNSNTSSSMTGSWGHDLSPDMHSSILAQYGINSGAGFTNEGFSNNQGSYLLSASINYSVSDTLNVSASFTQTNGPTGFTSKTGSHEIAIVTVHKTIY